MRQIKFRAYHKENRVMAKVIEWFSGGRVGVSIQDSGPFLWRDTANIELMQFTDLTDRHGRDIYESDILRNKSDRIVVVFWNKELAVYDCNLIYKRVTGNSCGFRNHEWGRSTEIIGNIHESPDLVK